MRRLHSAPELFRPLRHRDYALVMGSFTAASVGSWAYNVGLVVWLIDATGSAGWVAAATLGRFLPALVLSAYAGVVAERLERVRLMRHIDVASSATMLALAAFMALDQHPVLIVATAAITSSLSTMYEPAAAALTPQLVEERELASANSLRNTIDMACVVAGPGIGALLMLIGPPPVAVLLNAATFALSAMLLRAVRTRSTPVDVTEGGEAGPLRQMLVGIRTLGGSSSARVLVGFSIVATFVFGVDNVLFVVLSEERLGTGPEGYGYLLAGLGVGGVLAAGFVPRLERLPRLGPVLLLGMTAYCLPTLLLLVVEEPGVAFAAQAVRGAGTMVVDVLAITALQRSLPQEVLGRVFGAFDSLVILAVLVGSALVPVALATVGLDVLLWLVGLGVPLACLGAWPALARMDREASERRTLLAARIALLEACDLFETVPEGALEQLAGAAEMVDVTAGEVIVTEGEPADAFYVIESGSYAVSAGAPTTAGGRARQLEDMGDGEWFGEIGLIEAIPRTATVTARTDGRLLRVEGQAFVATLSQTAPSAVLLDGAAVRLGRTHPSLKLSRAGLAGAED